MSFIERSWEQTDQIVQGILSARLESGDDDSFYVFNVHDVVRKFEFWSATLPRVKPFFAMKANHSDVAIKVMAKLGSGFDCASTCEIRRILDVGVHPDRIVYANPSKQISHLKFARESRVEKMTFDNIDELQKVKSTFPEAKLLLRIKCDCSKAFMTFGEKFGCDPETEAPELIAKCQEMELNLIGICFHAGFRLEIPEVFGVAIRTVKKLFEFAASIGITLKMVDVGGGFWGNDMQQVENCAAVINGAIDECFPDESVEIIAEPGSYFMQTSMKLLVNVHSKRVQRSEDGRVSRIRYFVNNGIYTSFLGFVLYDYPRAPPKVFHKSKEPRASYDAILWGQSCSSTDKICELKITEMEIGDWLIFEHVGAYGYCYASRFNGFSVPDIIPIAVNDRCRTLLE